MAGVWLSGTGMCVAHGQVYRWVDEEGQIIYSDQLPPAYAKVERVIISEKGRIVTVVGGGPAAGSDDDPVTATTHPDAGIAEEQRRASEALRWQGGRDRALLQTYGDLEELRFARDMRLAQLDSRIGAFQSKAADLRSRINMIESQAASGSHKNLPQNYERELESLKRDLKIVFEQVELELGGRAEVEAQFESDIARYAALKADRAK